MKIARPIPVPSILFSLAVLAIAGLLSACAPQRPEVTVSQGAGAATNTPAPTDTPSATDTPAPTDTPVPTDTPTPTDTPVPTDTPTPTATSVESGEAGVYQPLSDEECQALYVAATTILGTGASLQETEFTDYVDNTTGTGCQVVVSGTGVDFANFVDVAVALRELFIELGWVEDTSYTADGPTGTAFGMRLEDKLALISVGWEPSEDANCPDDQPISECELQPEQQIYFISIELAERVNEE